MRVSAAAYTTKGLLKKVNQDNILLRSFQEKYDQVWLAVVCDGVGGLDCGEKASSHVVEAATNWFDKFVSEARFSQCADCCELLGIFANEVNVELLDLGIANGQTLGTTLTALLIINEEFYVLHIGDTRVYFIDEQSINRLTKDHTHYERYVDAGDLERANRANKNTLWQCIGGSRKIDPQVFKGKLKSGTFLICSDGFRDEVSETELQEKIRTSKVRSATKLKGMLEELTNLNIERNEKDNISAILVDVSVE